MQIMWAWYNKKKNRYSHIYRTKFLVKTCSADGFKVAIKEGKGEIVKVQIQSYNKTAAVYKDTKLGYWVAVDRKTKARIGGYHDSELEAYKAANFNGYIVS